MENKKITLLACTIENEDVSRNHSDLYEKLKTKLNTKTSADARRMLLNSASQEEDLLSDFAISDIYIYGIMFRIAPAKESPSIPENLFKNDTININDIKSQEENLSIICKEQYYFALNKSVLITSIPKSKIKSFQTYLNWLLGDTDYKFTPKIKSQEKIKLGDIKNIEFKDAIPNPIIEETNKVSIMQIALNKIKCMVVDVPNLNEVFDERLLSAKLLLKFSKKKPKTMTTEYYSKVLGYMMKPIYDDDGITINLKNGKKISGSNIIHTKIVEIEKIDSFKISEADLRQEILKFLREF